MSDVQLKEAFEAIPGSPDPNKRKNVKKIRQMRLQKRNEASSSRTDSINSITIEPTKSEEDDTTFHLPQQSLMNSEFYDDEKPSNAIKSIINTQEKMDIFAYIRLLEKANITQWDSTTQRQRLPQKYVDKTNFNFVPLSQISFESSDEERAEDFEKKIFKEEPLTQFYMNTQLQSLLDNDWTTEINCTSDDDTTNNEINLPAQDEKQKEFILKNEQLENNLNTSFCKLDEEHVVLVPQATNVAIVHYSSGEESDVTIKDIEEMYEQEDSDNEVPASDIHLPVNLDISSDRQLLTQTLYDSFSTCAKLFKQKSDDHILTERNTPETSDNMNSETLASPSSLLIEQQLNIISETSSEDSDFLGFTEHEIYDNHLYKIRMNTKLESEIENNETVGKTQKFRRSLRNRTAVNQIEISEFAKTRKRNRSKSAMALIGKASDAIACKNHSTKIADINEDNASIFKLNQNPQVAQNKEVGEIKDTTSEITHDCPQVSNVIDNPHPSFQSPEFKVREKSHFSTGSQMLNKHLLAELEMEDMERMEQDLPDNINTFSRDERSTVKPSEALSHSQCILNDISIDDKKSEIITTSEDGIGTDKLREDPIKYHILKKSILDDKYSEASDFKSLVSGMGFSTARGGHVKVSKKALEKAINVFDELDCISTSKQIECELPIKDFNNFSFSKSKNMLNEIGAEESYGNLARSQSADVATSSFDQVPCLDEKHNSLRNSSNSSLKPAYGIAAKSKTLSLPSKNSPKLNEFTKTEGINFGGFNTARGGPLAVSKKALTRAKRVFDEVKSETDNAGTPSKIQKSSEFQSTPVEDVTPRIRMPMRNINLQDSFATSTPLTKRIKFCNSNLSHTQSLLMNDDDDDLIQSVDENIFCNLFDIENESKTETPSAFRNKNIRKTKLLSRFDNIEEDANDSLDNIMLNVNDEIKTERKRALQLQQTAAGSKDSSSTLPKIGTLCSFKQSNPNRQSLKDFFANVKPYQSNHGQNPKSLQLMTFENAPNFKFIMSNFYNEDICLTNVEGIQLADDMKLIMDENSCCGVTELKSAFNNASGVDVKLIPSNWFENHFKFIIIKLAAMERYPENYKAGHRIMTPENLLLQMKYRYDREIDMVHRSALRKILEKDDIASKRLVLFVSNIYRSLIDYEVELSDGWYSVRAELDLHLQEYVKKNKIKIGAKLIICGAELRNLNDGCSPLEIPENVRLKIHANSTRRVKWDTRLGFYKVPSNFHIYLDTVLPNGGNIGKIIVCVVRLYPLLYMEKHKENSSTEYRTVLRSEKYERKFGRHHENKCQQNMENIYEQVLKELEKEEENRRLEIRCSISNVQISEIICPQELFNLLEYSHDPEFIQEQMSISQKEMVLQYQSIVHNKKQEEIKERVQSKLKTEVTQRNVTPLLRVRIVDAEFPKDSAILTIWNPSADVHNLLQEEKAVLEIENVFSNGKRNGEIQITSSKLTTYRKLNNFSKYDVDDDCFRHYTPIAKIQKKSFSHEYNEFDTIGIVVGIGMSESKGLQPVYIADRNMQFLRINFWKNITEYAYEDVVTISSILAICNLQWRPNHTNEINEIPQAFVTEMTTITETTRRGHLKEHFDRFIELMKSRNRQEYCRKAFDKIQMLEYNSKQNNISFNLNTSRSNSTITGHIKTEPMTPDMDNNSPRSSVQDRINRLKVYGSPPKLSPIAFRNSQNAHTNFKTPIRLGLIKNKHNL